MDLSAPRRIDSPGDLEALLLAATEAVREGTLTQYFAPTAGFATTEDVRQIAPKGPWPDYLELYFRDPATGKRYKLVAETYHGSGGSWEPLP